MVQRAAGGPARPAPRPPGRDRSTARRLPPAPRSAARPTPSPRHRWRRRRSSSAPSFTHRGYLDAVARVREYIVAGDIFQANLSQRFEAPLARAAVSSCIAGCGARNPAPFAAYLDFAGRRRCSAPRRSASCASIATGQVETRPIKGTRPRGLGPEHDAALGQALAESEKDRAENLMIVDLMRNDLSRVCAPGTRARARAVRARALRHRAPSGLDRGRASWRRAPTPSTCCGRRFPAARSPAPRRCARWRSSPSWSRRGAASTAARSATGASTGALDTSIVIRTCRGRRRPGILPGRRRHRRRLRSRAGVPGDAGQGPRH